MAFEYGFFNSINGDRVYNAESFNKMFDGLITTGVFDSVDDRLVVSANSGLTIKVGTGRGWFNKHWVTNDSNYLITLSPSDVVLNRYVGVIVKVDETQSVRAVSLELKYGAFASNPTKPVMTRSELVNEYCLAYVYQSAGATVINNSDIEDTRADPDLCGWASSVVYDNSNIAPVTKTITLPSAGWFKTELTVTVLGMTSSKVVLVSPVGGSRVYYSRSGISCVGQGTNTLRFKAEADHPQYDLEVNVTYFGA